MVFTLMEGLFIVIVLSVVVFLTAEYEGSNLRKLNARKVLLISLIFILGQIVSMGCGYMISRLPFFQRTVSIDVKKMCNVLAALLFFLIGGYLLFRGWLRKPQDERLRELLYRRIVLEALTVAILTFGAGIACGFLHAGLVSTFIAVAFITLGAVVAGLYTGYSQGGRFMRIGYSISSFMFMATGIEVLIRFI